jgi:phospholipid/cholesterol/gamma-HCH transport system substrate-binding protein
MAVRNPLAQMSGRVLGVVFLILCLLFVWFTYAIFTKKFVDYDEVTLQSSKIGLSLPTRADVKIRGVLVGEVLETETSGDGAELTLGLYPETRDTIPANVTGSILPKTLFGEKYVALDVPASPEDTPIKPGETIERTDVAIEVEEVLNDLYPLLRTVRPADLNFTLTAVANALEGRGEKLGASLETLDGYLKRMNPELPALLESLDNLGEVARTYDSVVPELTRLLRNTVKTTNTFESKEDQIQALFDDVAGFSGTAEAFLRQNGDNLITLSRQGTEILPVFARYSSQFPCFLDGIVTAIPRNASAFRDRTLHIILETLPRQPRGYDPRDLPVNADDRGPFPYCDIMYDAIRGRYGQHNLPPDSIVPNIQDGVDYPVGKRAAVGEAVSADPVVGTERQKRVIDVAASQVLGVPVTEVPDLATLLLGPLARGKAVGVQ